MRATELIYREALKKPIRLSNGKTLIYKDIQTEKTDDERCWLCGALLHGKGVPVKTAIKPTFMDAPLAKVLYSKTLCNACAFCLSCREMRNYSIVASDQGLEHPTRAEIRDILLNPPPAPFVVCIAVSGQKWVHIKSHVAYSREEFPVQMEEMSIIVNPQILAKVLEPVEELYTGGFRKTTYKDKAGEIETGEYESWKIKQFGIERWEELENQIISWRGQRIFNLALFLAQKKEED